MLKAFCKNDSKWYSTLDRLSSSRNKKCYHWHSQQGARGNNPDYIRRVRKLKKMQKILLATLAGSGSNTHSNLITGIPTVLRMKCCNLLQSLAFFASKSREFMTTKC